MCVGDGGDTFTVMTDEKNFESHQAKRCSKLALKVVPFFGGRVLLGKGGSQANSFSALFCSRVSEVACQQSIHEQVRESSRGALHAGACVEERGGGGGGGSKAAQGGGAWLVCLGELWVASETGLVNEI